MCGQSKAYKDIHTKMNFKDVKSNFFSAARNGLATQFIWNGELVSSQQLILDELLPMAYRGLYSMGVSPDDAERYLTVIERRVKSKDGARWMVRSYRNLLSNRKRCDALQVLTEKIHEKQSHDYPVSTWSVLNSAEKSKIESPKRVRHVMSTDIFSVDAKDSIELVLNIMKWKNIHHMPVIDDNKALIGLISWSDLEGIDKDPEKLQSAVKTFMVDRVISTHQFTTLEEAKRLMTKHKINCLPVVKDDLLIGIVTSNDIQNL